jgi:hypothetical protein
VAEEAEVKQAPKATKTTPPRAEKKCAEKGCKRPYRAKGYCNVHYRLWRRGELGTKQRYKICSKEGCRKPMVRWGLCQEHFEQAKSGAAASA